MHDWTPEQLKTNLDEGRSVFLKLWKPGCGACKLSEPALTRLEESFGEQLTFCQIDTLKYPELLDLADTDVLPVFFIFINQQKKGQHIGFKGIKKLQQFIETSLNNPES